MTDDDFSDHSSDRDVSPALTVGEGDIDVSLRPRSLGEFIGQPRVREQLQLVIEGAKTAAAHRITSCCPGRPVWARHRWR
jgi:Holliday junction DNA helicase RuvB